MRVFLAVIFLVLLGYAAGFVLFVSNLPGPPANPPRADGIVALTGGDERLDTAVSLLEHGAGKRLLVSGVSQMTTKETVRKMSGGGARFQCCADIGYAADDTHGNALEAAEWAREHHFASLVIVTGRYHMPRTMREFSAVLPEMSLIAYPVEQNRIDLGGWWTHPRTAELLHREYVKYLASLVTTRLAR
ncbi:MAG TPA: YdcF family protein [Rhizomicrobium sp.]|nr:YdcF family protein [Rhizomicrobium sp.]